MIRAAERTKEREEKKEQGQGNRVFEIKEKQ
jgi:hypothetical protein